MNAPRGQALRPARPDSCTTLLKRVSVLVAAATALSPGHAAKPANVEGWVAANKAQILREYVDLLSIPNAASDAPNIRRNAVHLLQMLKARGIDGRLLEGEDPLVPPAVFGEWRVRGATRTLVFYAHYDGQPVSPEEWSASQPFKPVLWSGRFDHGASKKLPLPKPGGDVGPNWRLYARSASDDKAGVMAILAAVQALRQTGRAPAFNVKIFFEGEEEAGSPHLASILARYKELLSSDGWVIIDGPAHQSEQTQVVLGVRGATGADITTYGPVRPLHSGHYGNWAPNPAMLLSQLLASMQDANGRVTISGFYDDMIPLSSSELQAIAAAPAIDETLKSDLQLARTEGSGRSLTELVTEPSLTINGLRSADVGNRASKIVPATATATVDMRLVKGNDLQRQYGKLVAHIRAQGYHVTNAEPTAEERLRHPLIAKVEQRSGYNAERTTLNDPLAAHIISSVRRSSRGKVAVLPTSGGSLPLYIFRETLGVPSVMVGLVNHDNNQHAENENICLSNLWEAISVTAGIMSTPDNRANYLDPSARVSEKP